MGLSTKLKVVVHGVAWQALKRKLSCLFLSLSVLEVVGVFPAYSLEKIHPTRFSHTDLFKCVPKPKDLR